MSAHIAPAKVSSDVRRQSLTLQAWEFVSSERHLQGVLEAVSDVLLPSVPFQGLGIVSFHDGNHDLYAMHLVGEPHREGESMADFMQRQKRPARRDLPSKPLVPMPADMHREIHAGVPYSWSSRVKMQSVFRAMNSTC